MNKFMEEKSWGENTEVLAMQAKFWFRLNCISDPAFEPNKRLVRDYVALEIPSKPEQKDKKAIFGFEQPAQFIACHYLS